MGGDLEEVHCGEVRSVTNSYEFSTFTLKKDKLAAPGWGQFTFFSSLIWKLNPKQQVVGGSELSFLHGGEKFEAYFHIIRHISKRLCHPYPTPFWAILCLAISKITRAQSELNKFFQNFFFFPRFNRKSSSQQELVQLSDKTAASCQPHYCGLWVNCDLLRI